MDEIKARLAVRIKHYREELKLSQEQLGRAVGKDKQTIWRLEKARSWPEWDTLAGLCRIFGVTPDALLAPDPGPDLPTTAEAAFAVFLTALNDEGTHDTMAAIVNSLLREKKRGKPV